MYNQLCEYQEPTPSRAERIQEVIKSLKSNWYIKECRERRENLTFNQVKKMILREVS